MDQFKIGDRVEWESQAGGRTTKKQGRVVWVMRANEGSAFAPLSPVRIAAKAFPGHRRMFGGYGIPGRADAGYLVEVAAGPRAKPRLYMPYPTKLRLAK